MSEELIVYGTYATIENAESIAGILEGEGIETQIGTAAKMLDTAIGGGTYEDKFILRIHGSDFNKATKVLREQANVDIGTLDSHDPMRSLSKEELLDVIAKPDEWGPENYNIAIQLLRQKGVIVSQFMLNDMEEKRIEVLSERKSIDPMILILGYSLAVANIATIFAFQHPVIGLTRWMKFMPAAIGIVLARLIIQSRTTLPNGDRIYTYNNTVTRHAVIIEWLSIVVVLINVIIQFVWMA